MKKIVQIRTVEEDGDNIGWKGKGLMTANFPPVSGSVERPTANNGLLKTKFRKHLNSQHN